MTTLARYRPDGTVLFVQTARVLSPRRDRTERPSYGAMHRRLRSRRGRASEFPCVECGEQAQEWAYDHEDVGALTSDGLPYSLDLEHYRPMCRHCHIIEDQLRARMLRR